MRLAVLKERRAGEARVAATPDTVKKLIGLGLSVAIEALSKLIIGDRGGGRAERLDLR
jgi:NAD/NADP transhydrogenase alpha subunit